MMNIQPIHSFHLTETEMREIQEKLCQHIKKKPLTHPIQYAAGVDVAYTNLQSYAVIVVMDYQRKKIVETVKHKERVTCPYIPGLLAFRELPSFLNAWRKLTITPDLVFFDGNGIFYTLKGWNRHSCFLFYRTNDWYCQKPVYWRVPRAFPQ